MFQPTKYDLYDLLKVLKELRDIHKPNCSKGICSFLTESQQAICRSIWVKWPKYAGSPCFPVPHPRTMGLGHGAYYVYHRWNKKSKYGQLRYELLDFLITTVEQQLKELS